jgi:glycosyltransferase involved in cell wall biosynthesis
MKVVHITPVFYPATYWGGPIFSMLGLCNALSRQRDLDLKVLATDSSGLGGAARLELAERIVSFEGGSYSVEYAHKVWGADIAPEMISRIHALVGWADVVHLSAVYSFPTLPTLAFARMAGKPIVWSPRGALQRWQGSTRRVEKYLWELLCNLLIDEQKTALHMTTPEEAKRSKARIRAKRVEVVQNGVDIPNPNVISRRMFRPRGSLRILYLGRLDPIKGLENLLEALEMVSEIPWSLRVCGSGLPEYVAGLKRKASSGVLSERVTFVGSVAGQMKEEEFSRADVCVLPSYSENFGMVVAEALARGVPVIAGDGTPWPELENRGAGFWIPNDARSLAEGIRRIQKADLEVMGEAGREWMRADYGWDAIAAKMRAIYDTMPKFGGYA